MNCDRLAHQLWSQLWHEYRSRVPYAQTYEQMIQSAGGTITNDHIAFRSLRLTANFKSQPIHLGLPYLEAIIYRLGYQVGGEYEFPEKHLYARHYLPPLAQKTLPKLFISELIVSELPSDIADLITQTVSTGSQFNLPYALEHVESMNLIQAAATLKQYFNRPWSPPKQSILESVNEVSQYGAWVLLHGYVVNHFTGYINHQNTREYQTIEQTAEALAARGVPMKANIEGNQKSGLKQTSTHAVEEWVTVEENKSHLLKQIQWPYAYFELAQRYPLEGDIDVYEGFQRTQAQHLFEMTQRKH